MGVNMLDKSLYIQTVYRIKVLVCQRKISKNTVYNGYRYYNVRLLKVTYRWLGRIVTYSGI